MIFTTTEAVDEELEVIQQLANKYEKSVFYGSSGEALQTTITAVFDHSPEICEDQPTIEVGWVHPEFIAQTTNTKVVP